MKMKKMIGVLALVLFLVVSFSGVKEASANYWLYSATVVKVSQQASGVSVTVTAGAVTLQKFLEPTNEKAMLAILLSADALTKPVHVYFDSGLNEITAVTLSNE